MKAYLRLLQLHQLKTKQGLERHLPPKTHLASQSYAAGLRYLPKNYSIYIPFFDVITYINSSLSQFDKTTSPRPATLLIKI
jgi:hypothetical protein